MSEPVGRIEFDGYVLRHEHDPFAHEAMRRNLETDLEITKQSNERRLTALERWQQRIIGGLMFGAFLVGGGGLAVAVELLRHA